jgi:site-specific recombinase XerD
MVYIGLGVGVFVVTRHGAGRVYRRKGSSRYWIQYQLADELLVHMENQRRASVEKIRSHLKPVRAFFDRRPAIDVTTASLERYQRQRLDAGKAPATVNREVHALRRTFNIAGRQTPPLFPKHLVPYFPSLPIDNVRSGFFERAEVDALLQHVEDDGIRDFIA